MNKKKVKNYLWLFLIIGICFACNKSKTTSKKESLKEVTMSNPIKSDYFIGKWNSSDAHMVISKR